MKIRFASPEIESQAREILGIVIMAPHQLRVLIILPLKLVNVLGGSRSKAWGLRLKQRQDVCIRTEIRDSRDLILRYGIEKNPADIIAIVVLVITAQIGIILLALIMIVRVARRRRLQTSARCDEAIQPVIAYLFANGASILKRRIHCLK